MIRSRPKVTVFFDWDVRPGKRFEVEVVLAMRRRVPVRFVHLSLIGVESATMGAGNSRATSRNTVLNLRAELLGEGELDVGKKQFRAYFDLPDDLPPSLQQGSVCIEYVLKVHVAIPWWPDRKSSFVVPMSASMATVQESVRPLRRLSHLQGPEGEEPYLELRIDRPQIVSGGRLDGAIALLNVASNGYRSVDYVLTRKIAKRRRLSSSWSSASNHSWSMRQDASMRAEGQTVPFSMQLPKDMLVSFVGGLVRVDWELEVTAKTSLLRPNVSLTAPLVVHAAASTRAALKRTFTALPTIGSDRVRDLWSSVAREQRLQLEADGMAAQVGELQLRIRREHRGRDGIFLVAHLHYPSLGLELDGGFHSGFRRLVGGGVLIGHKTWDRRHYLVGREKEQVEAFVQPLGELLQPCRVVDVCDTECTLERRNAGTRKTALAEFVADALRLAHGWEAARRGIVMPALFRAHRANWQMAASDLDCSLQPGDMRLSGKLDGVAVTIETVWQSAEEVLETRASLSFAAPTDPAHRQRCHQGGWLGGVPAAIPARARAMVEGLVQAGGLVAIEEERVVVVVEGMVSDPRKLLQRLARLMGLEQALQGSKGPYR